MITGCDLKQQNHIKKERVFSKMASLQLAVCAAITKTYNDDQLGPVAAGGHVALQRVWEITTHTHARPSMGNLCLTSAPDPIRKQTEKSSRSARCLTTHRRLFIIITPWVTMTLQSGLWVFNFHALLFYLFLFSSLQVLSRSLDRACHNWREINSVFSKDVLMSLVSHFIVKGVLIWLAEGGTGTSCIPTSSFLYLKEEMRRTPVDNNRISQWLDFIKQ